MSLLRYPLPRPATSPQTRSQIFAGAGAPPTGTTTNVSVLATQAQKTVALAVVATTSTVVASATQDQSVVVARQVIRSVGAASQPQALNVQTALREPTAAAQTTADATPRVIARFRATSQPQAISNVRSLQFQFAASQGELVQATVGGHSTKTHVLRATQAQGTIMSTGGHSSVTLVATQAQAFTATIQRPRTLVASQSGTVILGQRLLVLGPVANQTQTLFASRLTRLTPPIAQTQLQPLALRVRPKSDKATQTIKAILILGAITPPARHPPITYPTVATITRSSTTGQITGPAVTETIAGHDVSAKITLDTRTAPITPQDTTDNIQTAALGN